MLLENLLTIFVKEKYIAKEIIKIKEQMEWIELKNNVIYEFENNINYNDLVKDTIKAIEFSKKEKNKSYKNGDYNNHIYSFKEKFNCIINMDCKYKYNGNISNFQTKPNYYNFTISFKQNNKKLIITYEKCGMFQIKILK